MIIKKTYHTTIGLVFWCLAVNIGKAQNNFLDKAFEGYPVDSIVNSFRNGAKIVNKSHNDSIIRNQYLYDFDYVKSNSSIFISGYEKSNDQTRRHTCNLDIEFTFETDSNMIKAYNGILDKIGKEGKEYSLAAYKTNYNSYVIKGKVFRSNHVYIVGIKTFNNTTNLILRKEIELD